MAKPRWVAVAPFCGSLSGYLLPKAVKCTSKDKLGESWCRVTANLLPGLASAPANTETTDITEATDAAETKETTGTTGPHEPRKPQKP